MPMSRSKVILFESYCPHRVTHAQIYEMEFSMCVQIIAVIIFVLSPPNIVGKYSVFSGCPVCPFVRSSVRPVRYSYHDILWSSWAISIKLTGNLASTDDLIKFWRSKVKVIAGRQGQILW